MEVWFEVFTAVTMNAVFWDVAPCRYCVNGCFGGTYRLHLQGIKIRERGTSVEQVAADWVASRLNSVPRTSLIPAITLFIAKLVKSMAESWFQDGKYRYTSQFNMRWRGGELESLVKYRFTNIIMRTSTVTSKAGYRLRARQHGIDFARQSNEHCLAQSIPNFKGYPWNLRNNYVLHIRCVGLSEFYVDKNYMSC
jgi:hypothetical protein